MLFFDALFREEKFGSGCIAFLEFFTEELVDGKGAAVILYLLGRTVE